LDVDEGEGEEGEANETGVAARGLALAQDNPAEVLGPAEQVLYGLITNDNLISLERQRPLSSSRAWF
jgi:hypothetical protein